MIYVKGTAVCDECKARADVDLHTAELNPVVELPEGWRHVKTGFFKVRLHCGACVKKMPVPAP